MKKILGYLKKPKKILLYLDNKKIIRLSDERYIKMRYEVIVGKKLNLENPKTFNEKLQWLILNDRKDIYTTIVDKYEVKKYVSDIIGKEYIIPTLGVYNSFDEIDFDSLPNQFVLKCTHDSGGVTICKSKEELNKKELKREINKHLKNNYYYIGREWPYKNVKPRIIAEEYMVDESETELKDYKIFCFNGQAKYIQVDFSRFTGHKRNIYDMNWNLTEMQCGYPSDPNRKIEKPLKLELMISLANKLAKGKKFIRVDFYSILDKVFFGEMTFYPGAGLKEFKPDSWNKKLGDLINIYEEE